MGFDVSILVLWIFLIVLFCALGSSVASDPTQPPTESPSLLPTLSSAPTTRIPTAQPSTRTPSISQKPTTTPTTKPTRLPTISSIPSTVPSFAPTYTPMAAPRSYSLSNFAGTGTAGYTGDGGPATSATLWQSIQPASIFQDASGVTYHSDAQYLVRKIDLNGIISVVLGVGGTSFDSGNGGPATSASVYDPMCVWMDSQGKAYVGTYGGNIRVIGTDGIVNSYAASTSWSLGVIYSLSGDSSGTLYVAASTNRILATTASGVFSSFAGTGTNGASGNGGPATSATMSGSLGLFVDSSANVYFSDPGNSVLRRIEKTSGIVSLLTGTGSQGFSGDGMPATSSKVSSPRGLWVDTIGNLFHTDVGSYRLRFTSAVDGNIYTIMGTGVSASSSSSGSAAASTLGVAYGLCRDVTSGGMLVTDDTVIRRLTPDVVLTAAPTLVPTDAPSAVPSLLPSLLPSFIPSLMPTIAPSGAPTERPTTHPTTAPTTTPTCVPTIEPSAAPTALPTLLPTASPSQVPSRLPSVAPSEEPSTVPTTGPSGVPSTIPTAVPSLAPTTACPSLEPTSIPTTAPTQAPSSPPSPTPSVAPSQVPTTQPSITPTVAPTPGPTLPPKTVPTVPPSLVPTAAPSVLPSAVPSLPPSLLPSALPSHSPTLVPTTVPTIAPTTVPSPGPSVHPSRNPSLPPTHIPTTVPTLLVTMPANATLPSNKSVSVVGIGSPHFKIVLPFLRVAQQSSSTAFSDVVVGQGSFGTNSIVFGGPQMGSVLVLDTSTASYSAAVSSDSAVRSVSPLGDVNGDGLPDLIIGDPANSRCYVLFGETLGYQAMRAGFTIFGESDSDLTGWSVSGAGDVNNDTLHDIVVGAPNAHEGAGALYVIYGSKQPRNIHLSALTSSQGRSVYGEARNDYLGLSVSGAGDVNGDGCDDVLAGAALTRLYSAGAAYVVYGGPSVGSVASAGLLSQQQRGFKVLGAAFASVGYSVAAAGDMNGDGLADVLVGSSPLRASSGLSTTYVIYGKPTADATAVVLLSALTHSQGIKIEGGGVAVGSIGDVNGDGFGDCLVGSSYGFPGTGYAITWDVKYTAPPTALPSRWPSAEPSRRPTVAPTTRRPVTQPTPRPSAVSVVPTTSPGTVSPLVVVSALPTSGTAPPSELPSETPSQQPSEAPSLPPSRVPTPPPTVAPTDLPTEPPSDAPSLAPSTLIPTQQTRPPAAKRTLSPTSLAPRQLKVTLSGNSSSYVRTGDDTRIVVNSTAAVVTILNRGGADTFVVLAREASLLVIEQFNPLADVIDLTHFPLYGSMADLTITAGSVIITLTNSQRVKLLNLSPSDMKEGHFRFAARSGDGGSPRRATLLLTISIVVPVGFALLFALSVYHTCNWRDRIRSAADDSALKAALARFASKTGGAAQSVEDKLTGRHGLRWRYSERLPGKFDQFPGMAEWSLDTKGVEEEESKTAVFPPLSSNRQLEAHYWSVAHQLAADNLSVVDADDFQSYSAKFGGMELYQLSDTSEDEEV